MSNDPTGKLCKLLVPIRAADGTYHLTSEPHPTVIRAVLNLGRDMLLIKLEDGSTSYVFPHEIEIFD